MSQSSEPISHDASASQAHDIANSSEAEGNIILIRIYSIMNKY